MDAGKLKSSGTLRGLEDDEAAQPGRVTAEFVGGSGGIGPERPWNTGGAGNALDDEPETTHQLLGNLGRRESTDACCDVDSNGKAEHLGNGVAGCRCLGRMALPKHLEVGEECGRNERLCLLGSPSPPIRGETRRHAGIGEHHGDRSGLDLGRGNRNLQHTRRRRLPEKLRDTGVQASSARHPCRLSRRRPCPARRACVPGRVPGPVLPDPRSRHAGCRRRYRLPGCPGCRACRRSRTSP